jgi:Tfp pilus assembly protein PilF
MKNAMQFQTPEPAFYYHAGMIANAMGRKEEARSLLKRALDLNPNFDTRQAPVADKAMKELS